MTLFESTLNGWFRLYSFQIDDAYKIVGPGNRIVVTGCEWYGERLDLFGKGRDDADESHLIGCWRICG